MIGKWLKRIVPVALSLALALGFTGRLLFGRAAQGQQEEQDRLQAPEAETAQTLAPQPPDGWQLLLLCDLDDGCTAQLCTIDGTQVDKPVFFIGEAATAPLQPGRYQVTLEPLGTAEFTLAPNGTVADVTGPAWTDGEMLYLTDQLCGTLTVERYLSPQAYASRLQNVYYYDLTLGGTTRTNALFFTDDLRPGEDGQYYRSCTFTGLPYGTYTLRENEGESVTISLREDQPALTVRFGAKP